MKNWWNFKTGHHFFFTSFNFRKNFFSKIFFINFVKGLKAMIILKKHNYSFLLKKFPLIFIFEFFQSFFSLLKLFTSGKIFTKNFKFITDYLFEENFFDFNYFCTLISKQIKSHNLKIPFDIKRYILFRKTLKNPHVDKDCVKFSNTIFLIKRLEKKRVFSKFLISVSNFTANFEEFFFLRKKIHSYFMEKSILIFLKNIIKGKDIIFFRYFLFIYHLINKNWNQKRLMAFPIFKKFALAIFKRTKKTHSKKKKYLIKKMGIKSKRINIKLQVARKIHQSPSSKRIEKMVTMRLLELTQDLNLNIKRRTLNFISFLILKRCCSKFSLFFVVRKTLKNVERESVFKKFVYENPPLISYSSSLLRKIHNLNFLRFSLFFLGKNVRKKKNLFLFNILSFIKKFRKLRKESFFENNFLAECILKSYLISLGFIEKIVIPVFKKKKYKKKRSILSKLLLDVFIELLNKKLLSSTKISQLQFWKKIFKLGNPKNLTVRGRVNFLKNLYSFILNLKYYEHNILRNYLRLTNTSFIRFARTFKNSSKLTTYFTVSKKNLIKRCSLSSVDMFGKLLPNFLFFFTKNFLEKIFSEPCLNMVELYIFAKVYFSNLNNIKQKTHQNHWIFLNIARVLINCYKKEDCVWHSNWEFICCLLGNYCIMPSILAQRILKELKKKLRFVHLKNDFFESITFKSRFLLIHTQFYYTIGFSFFQESFNNRKSSKTPTCASNINFKNDISFLIKKFISRKKKGKTNSFFNNITENIESKSREVRTIGLFILLKFSTRMKNKKSLVFYAFFVSYYYYSNQLYSMLLIFFVEVTFVDPVLFEEIFCEICQSFRGKNFVAIKKVFNFLFQIFYKKISKGFIEYVSFISSIKNKSILVFRGKIHFFKNIFYQEKFPPFSDDFDYVLNLIKNKNLKELDFIFSFYHYIKTVKKSEKSSWLFEKILIWFKIFRKKEKWIKLMFCIKFLTQNETDMKKFINPFFFSDSFFNQTKFFDIFLKVFFKEKNKNFFKNNLINLQKKITGL